VPSYISKPLNKLAKKLDRPNRISYADMVLLNWRVCPPIPEKDHRVTQMGSHGILRLYRPMSTGRNDTKGATEEDQGLEDELRPCGNTKGRIRIMQRFLAVPTEEWFWALHVALEGEARGAIYAIHNGIAAIQQNNMTEVTQCLDQLSDALRSLIRCHPDPYPHSSRAELVLMRRLKPFLAPKASLKEFACLVYAGHSAILPSLFKFLGVKRGRHRLQKWRDDLVNYMPNEHRKFVGIIESTQSVRSYLKSRIADRKQQSQKSSRMHDVAVLEGSFNRCIEQLLRFCSRRSQLVCRCMPQVAQWFREVEMRQEAEYLTRSHCALLIGHMLMAPIPPSIEQKGKNGTGKKSGLDVLGATNVPMPRRLHKSGDSGGGNGTGNSAEETIGQTWFANKQDARDRDQGPPRNPPPPVPEHKDGNGASMSVDVKEENRDKGDVLYRTTGEEGNFSLPSGSNESQFSPQHRYQQGEMSPGGIGISEPQPEWH